MPASSTKRRGSTSGRHRTGGSSSSQAPSYRPGVHPILPTRTSDQVASKRPKVEQPVDVKAEQQEILEVLETGSKPQNTLTPKDDVIDRYVEEDLGITDPDSQPQPTGPVTASFTPTIGRPEKKGKAGESISSGGSSSPASTNSGDSAEKKKLSDFINEERSTLQNDLKTKSNTIKSQKISGWNFRGKIKSRLKRAILGMAIAALVAVPIAAIGVIPHAIQSWIANRTSVYVERAADKMGQKLLFAYFRDRVAVEKCKNYYNNVANASSAASSTLGVSACRPRLDEKDGRLSQLFNDWHSAKMEDLLAKNGIAIEYNPDPARDGNPDKPYSLSRASAGGNPVDLRLSDDLASLDWDVGDFMGRREASKVYRQAIKETLKNDARGLNYLQRRNMKAGYLRDLNLKKRFWGPKTLAQKLDDAEIKRNKKYTRWRQHLTQHIAKVGEGRLAFILEILFEGNKSKAQYKNVISQNAKLRKAADKLGWEEVEKLIDKYAGKSARQISKQVILDLIEKIFGIAVRESVETATKAIPIIGQILLVFSILDILDMLSDGTLQKMLSVMNSQSMIDMSNIMDTTLSEERKGYVDVASGGDLRLSLIKGMSASRVFTNTVGYKSPKDKQAAGYDCKPNVSVNDIKSVIGAATEVFGSGDPDSLPQVGMQDGMDTCENHRVDYNPLDFFTKAFSFAQFGLEKYTKDCAVTAGLPLPPGFDLFPDLPGLPKCPSMQQIYHGWNNVIGWVMGHVSFLFSWMSNIPIIKKLTELGITWFTNAVAIFITGNSLSGAELLQGGLRTDTKTGARIFDSWSGGQQVTQNAFAKGVGDGGGLGLVAQTPAETGVLNRSIAQERKEELASGSLFERMFDISHADTLVSGVTAFAFSEGGFSNIVNPFNNIALAFSSGTSSAFAGNADQDYCGDANQFGKAVTEFGVICYAIADDLIDGLTEEEMVQYSDPEFCKQYTAELDAELAEKENETYPSPNQDPDGSGQATRPNYCRLMCSVTDSMGTNFRSNDPICGFEKYASGSTAGSSGDDDSGDGSNNDPVEGAMGKCEGVEIIRPNAGKPANDVEIQIVPGTTIDILAELCMNVKTMIEAASQEGVKLNGGGFRTYDEQVDLRRSNCGTSDYAVYQMPASSCRPPTARPGTSNHERGKAIDFSNCGSRGTACYKWLNNNAARFGFKNLPSESWHWSTDGR